MDQPGCSRTDKVIVTLICFGLFIVSSSYAVVAGFPTQPFNDTSAITTIIVEGIMAAAAVIFLRIRGYDLANLRSSPTFKGCLAGILLFAVGVVVDWLLKAILSSSYLASQPIEQMVAKSTISFIPLIGMAIVNGFYEETFLLGYLQRALDGTGSFFAISAVLFIRMLYHTYQGPIAVISIVGFGFIIGLYFQRKKELWPAVFAHIITDFSGFAMRGS
jgi:membrane protease YdiL (CAAX protease family)